MVQPPVILALESSCDETAAAVMRSGKLLANPIATQAIHAQYGGVVPELASRAPQQHIVPVVTQALKEAKIDLSELDAVAFTQGPGLLGALLVGVSYAKALALGLGVPLIGVHHMQAHILAHWIEEPQPKFPFLCLTVSGGHTQLVLVRSHLDMEIIGQTRDDAVGEAFDKTAKLLGLPYPGGPLIDQHAQTGDPQAFRFSEVAIPGLDFSFSGLKTSILYFLRAQLKANPDFIKERLPDICASVQHTLVSILTDKLTAAAQQYGVTQVGIAGGVSANSALRKAVTAAGQQHGWQTYIPKFAYCTDNAGMIAMAAHYLYEAGQVVGQSVGPEPRMPFPAAG